MSRSDDSDIPVDSSDEEDGDSNAKEGSSGLNLAGFLFGNIDADGKLDDSDASFLDETSKKKLGGLSQVLGLGSLINEAAKDEGEEIDEKQPDEDYEEGAKDPDAQDFSAIDDALTDDSSSSSSSSSSDEEEPKKKEEKPKESTTTAKKVAAEELPEKKEDEKLMPPPPPQQQKPQVKPTENVPAAKKPLAGMLPERYKNVDVRQLFPEFRENQVLRFSRLFPIKASYKPRIWKNVKRRIKEEEEENEDEPHKKKVKGFDSPNFAPLPTDPDAYVEDQAVRFHRPLVEKNAQEEEDKQRKKAAESKGPRPTDWRTGPAQYWYDMLDLADEVADFDYGLKSKDDVKREDEEKDDLPPLLPLPDEAKVDFTDDAFLMVTQVNWEDDVIWNGDDIKHKVLQKLNSKTNAAGWVPSSFNRTAGSFSQPGKGGSGTSGLLQTIKPQTMQLKRPTNDDETWHSIFPVENEELVYGRWEDEVIWDHDNMPIKIKPKMVSIDPNDDNIILGIPDDIDPSTLPTEGPVRKIKIIQKHVKKSRMLLNRSGIINVIEEESPPPPPKVVDKDPYNLSNDEFYSAKTQESLIKVATGGTLLQHATPVVELRAPFVPTHMGPMKLRQFHRFPLKRYSHGPLADFQRFHGGASLQKHMKKRAKEREREREAAGGGDIFFMRTPEDVTGKDGELVLMEYMEEHPPLLSLVGMCSKVKNYYKRKPGNDSGGVKHKYGETTLAHTSPFLGTMMPGQTIQTMENALYRAPIYEHKIPSSDFLVIRTRNEYSIRELDSVFVVGQECPLYEVPGPNSKKANNFTRDFLQVFIYRLFWGSRDNPRRIKMDDIKKAFPAHSESSIRKRLKPCAEFHRTGHDSNFWVIKSNFRLPTEDEIRAMVSPEQCCAFFSMIAAEQRLKDAGYGEKSLLAPQDDDDEETAMKMDVEVQVAPWNTTRAYILAMKGKCLLQLTGPADPTGPAGEGFSYVRIPNKPTNKEEQEQQPKRTVTGTDADLRKLPLKDARAILRQNGVPEEEIKRLSRWEVIDVVRTLSTEKVKAGEDGDHKFSRGNRFSIAEHQERYREDCQRIFDVQNKVLASDELLSSDEADSSEEEDDKDEDLHEMGKSLENLLSNKKSSSQIMREREERERRKLQEMIESGDTSQGPTTKRKKEDDEQSTGSNMANKVLRITRVFKNPAGKEYTRTELVRKSLVIETYIRVRQTKNEEFIKQFATLDEQAKEEMKKEKRRIQEQLRRIKRNREKEMLLAKQQEEQQLQQERLKASKAAKRMKAKPDLKVKCGACGGSGHMRTNKACPKFVPEEYDMMEPVNVAMTERDEEEMEKEIDIEHAEGEELVNVDGTKVTLHSKVIKHADEIRRRSMILKVPKQAMKAGSKRRRAGTVEHCDYLTNKNYKTIKRRRTDPLITLASFLDVVHGELRVMDEALQFLQPVNTKKVTDYLEKIKNPMDLQTVRDNIQKKKYHSREDFMSDINQIVENSVLYNGEDDLLTVNARKLLDLVIAKFQENEERLIRLEKAINPLLDDNDQVALTYILESILNDNIKSMQESWPFMKPVNKKQMKHYYDRIKDPMDLGTMTKKVAKHAYHSRADFLRDMELIYNNSRDFNGEQSEYTLKAKKILDVTLETLEPYAEHMEGLEEKIREAQQRALDQADVDSLGTSLGELDDSSRTASEMAQPMKRKRGRPRKVKQAISKEYIDVGSEENSRLDFSDEFQDDDDDDDPDDEDWQDVDEETGFTVTVDAGDASNVEGQALVSMGSYYQEVQAGDGRAVQIEAPSYVLHEQVVEDEQVDESYDPTDFLQNLPKPAAGETYVTGTIDVAAAVNAAGDASGDMVLNIQPATEADQAGQTDLTRVQLLNSDGTPVANTLDVITQDLDISDSDDEEEGENHHHRTSTSEPQQQPQQEEQKPSAETKPSEPDDDGIWF